MIRDKIRKTWVGMISRCHHPGHKDWKNYGERGIQVCQRWRDKTEVPQKSRGRPSLQGFLNFLEDMGPTWFPGATIDRIDNDGDYTPDNCRWVTRSENTREMNQRRLSNGTHNLLDSTVATNSNNKRVKNGTHPFQTRIDGSNLQTDRVKDGTHHFLKKGIVAVFDSYSNQFKRIPKEEYDLSSNNRFFSPNSLYVKTLKMRGAL